MTKPIMLFSILLLLVTTPLKPITAETPVSQNIRAEALYRDGVQNLLRHRYRHAETAMLQALKLDPQNGKIHWEAGWVYWQQKQWKKVLFHWGMTRRFTPQQEDLDKFEYLAKQYLSWELKAGQQTEVFEAPSGWIGSQTGHITISAVGDIMMGSDFKSPSKLPPEDGIHLFSAVSPYLKSDLTFGNLEGPLTSEKKSVKCRKSKNCYAFRTPTRYVKNLKTAGFNVVNLANNHITDFGINGLKDTISALRLNRISHFGTIGKPATIVMVNGIKVAFLGVATTYCCIHVNQIRKSTKIVKRLKKEADLVVISFHGGAEGLKALHTPVGTEFFYGENRGDVRKFSHAMIDAGADLVLGHGPHTLRGLERYRGKLIAYSLGNFLGYLGFNTSGHLRYSMILTVTLNQAGRLQQLRVTPLRMHPTGIPELDPEANTLVLLNDLSRSDFGPAGVLLDKHGEWQSE